MNNMTLAQRDLYLVRIEEELNKKKEFLLNKYNHLVKWKKTMNI